MTDHTSNSIARSHCLRSGRVSIPGQVYLLTTNCFERQPLLATTDAAEFILGCLKWLDASGRIVLHGAVVMPDHLHMVAALRDLPLDRVMHSFKSYSAHGVNLLFPRCGAVWQSGFHDHALRSDESLFSAVMYCLGNPVRSGLVAEFHQYPYRWCRWEV
ncbi:MAG TPA: transposase [Xanthomonadaceae bacterium]|nr:transposase [Xanthomonadaceae bacterium]